MGNKIFIFAGIGFIAGTFLMGCGKTPEQKVENARTEYLAEWQTFKRDSEQKIDANEKRIDTFKEAGPEDKAKYNKEVEVLEQKNRDLKKKLEDYKDEGQSKWEEFKTNFNHDMDGIGKIMKDLFKDND